MGWVAINEILEAPKNSYVLTGVYIARNASHSRFQPRWLISIRPLLMETPPPFLKVGAPISVEFGTGEFMGRLRITSGGPHHIRAGKLGPRTKESLPGALLVIAVPVPQVLRAPRFDKDRRAVGHDWTDEWLEIELPKGWLSELQTAHDKTVADVALQPKAASTPTNGGAGAPKGKSAPFSMIGQTRPRGGV